VAVAIDVPDEKRLGRQLALVDDGVREDRAQPSLQLADVARPVIHEDPGEGREDAIVRRIHDEDRVHALPPLRCPSSLTAAIGSSTASGREAARRSVAIKALA